MPDTLTTPYVQARHGTIPFADVQEQVRTGLLSTAGAATIAALWSSSSPEGQTFSAFAMGRRVPLPLLADAIDTELARTPNDPELLALLDWVWEQDSL